MVTASADKTARLWNSSTGQLLAVLSGHTSSVSSARFSSDGQWIVTASDDRTARVSRIQRVPEPEDQLLRRPASAP